MRVLNFDHGKEEGLGFEGLRWESVKGRNGKRMIVASNSDK